MLHTLALATIFGDFGDIIATSSPFAKFIILVLFILSVVSWAVIGDRYRRLRRAEREDSQFWQRFDRLENYEQMEGLSQWCEKSQNSSLGRIFRFFHREFWPRYLSHRGQGSEDTLRGLLRRGADRVASQQIEELERGVTWLATLSSIAPFLGLLGTVWGIMGSFLQIGRQGTATLDAVGPGIAEALVTTVCGLFVAIPAVIGYNWLLRRIRGQESDMVRLISMLEDQVAAETLTMSEEEVRVNAGGFH